MALMITSTSLSAVTSEPIRELLPTLAKNPVHA